MIWQPIEKWLEEHPKNSLNDSIRHDLIGDVTQTAEYLFSLHEESDWAFVIKANAIIEAAISELLINYLNEDKIRTVVERLPLADAQIGKLSLAKDLGIISKYELNFIRLFATLRNNLVHRLENRNFRFSEYFEAFDKNQLKSWRQKVILFPIDESKPEEWLSNTVDHPKPMLCLAIGKIILSTVFYSVFNNSKKDQEAIESLLESMVLSTSDLISN